MWATIPCISNPVRRCQFRLFAASSVYLLMFPGVPLPFVFCVCLPRLCSLGRADLLRAQALTLTHTCSSSSNCHPQQLLLISRGPFQGSRLSENHDLFGPEMTETRIFHFQYPAPIGRFIHPWSVSLWTLPFHFLNNLVKRASYHSYVTSQKRLLFALCFLLPTWFLKNIKSVMQSMYPRQTNCLLGCLKCYTCIKMIFKDVGRVPKSQTPTKTSHGNLPQNCRYQFKQ